jgi:hypothetical protein
MRGIGPVGIVQAAPKGARYSNLPAIIANKSDGGTGLPFLKNSMKGFLKFLHNERADEPVLVVSGLPRSGTSLMMMMLEAAGIPPLTDREREADQDNPKGYFEFERVKKLKEGDTKWVKEAPGKAVKVISALLSHLPKGYNYKVLFMVRTLPEILASQRKMLVNRGEDPDKISDAEMAGYFEKHLRQVREWLKSQANFSLLEVDYNQLLTDPEPLVHEINLFLGGNLEEERMLRTIDRQLYRQRKQQAK